jgi:hypothetical protein
MIFRTQNEFPTDDVVLGSGSQVGITRKESKKGRQIGMATGRLGGDFFFLVFDLALALASESMEAHDVAMAITSAADLSSSYFSPKQAFADSESLYTRC